MELHLRLSIAQGDAGCLELKLQIAFEKVLLVHDLCELSRTINSSVY